MKGLYKMEIDFGRMGELEGIFIADSEKLDELIASGNQVYFGEVLGKHSEVNVAMKTEFFSLVTFEENVVDIFLQYDLSSGYNPFDYIDEDEYDDEDE